MSKELPWMKYYPGDFYGDPMVQVMTDDQELIYHRFIARSWQMGALPNDEEKLAVIAGMEIERFRKSWCWPLTEKWVKNGEGLINHRVEDERDDALSRSEGARRAGEMRQQRRRARVEREVSGSSAGAQREHSGTSAMLDPDPDPDKEEEKNKTGGVGGEKTPKAKQKDKNVSLTPEWKNMIEWFKGLSAANKDLVNDTFVRVGETRASGKLSDRAVLNIWTRMMKHKHSAVIRACQTYSEKEMQLEGKDEKYLLGIVRGEERGK